MIGSRSIRELLALSVAVGLCAASTLSASASAPPKPLGRSLWAAVWCKMHARRAPELGRSASLHLAVLRGWQPSVEPRPLLVA